MSIPLPPPFEGMALAPPPKKTWLIVIQQRCAYNGRFEQNDFRAWRQWSVWPLLFASKSECERFIRECFTFKNLHGRKMSASAMEIHTFRRLTVPGRPRRNLKNEDFR